MFLNIAALSCNCTDGFSRSTDNSEKITDIDDAILRYTAKKGVVPANIADKFIKSYPFSDEHKVSGNLWEINGAKLICIKGEPENVFALSRMENLFSEQEKRRCLEEKGYTAAAFAYAVVRDADAIPASIIGTTYNFIGICAFSEQIQPFVPDAISACHNAGAEVIMFTGASAETAVAVAERMGFDKTVAADANEINFDIPGFNEESALPRGIAAPEQAELNEKYSQNLKNEHENVSEYNTGEYPKTSEPLSEHIKSANIYARINRRQKTAVVNALKQHGEIVAAFGNRHDDTEILETAQAGVFARPAEYNETELPSAPGNGHGNWSAKQNAAFEAGNLIVPEQKGFASFAEILGEARLIMRDVRNCLFVYVSGSTAFLAFSLLAFLLRPAMLFNGSLAALAEVVFIPAACLFYVYGKNPDNKKFAASKFLVTKKLNRNYVSSVALRSTAVFLAMILSSLVSPEPKTGAFVSFVASLVIMNWLYLAAGTNPIRLIMNPNNKYAAIVSAVTIVLALFFTYTPFINDVFGLSPINPLLAAACIAASAVLQAFMLVLDFFLRELRTFMNIK
jgi:magnesium-transporting ATPase (P-type)